MEGLARHLNITIPPYVPISPFKDTDAPPVILDRVKFEDTELDNCEESSKLIKNNRTDSGGDSNSIESSNSSHKAVNVQVQVSDRKIEELKSGIKTKEDILSSIESSQTELKSSSETNQLCVNDLYNSFDEAIPAQTRDCSARLQHEEADVIEDVRIKHEDLESSVCELQRPVVPLKKTKYNRNAAF